MVFKAVGLKPQGILARVASRWAFRAMTARAAVKE
jgi:hypothetical protein